MLSGSLILEDFCRTLKEEAGLEDPDLKWREAAGPFARVSTSHEIDYGKPLNASTRAPDAQAVRTLEKLFGVFQPIKQLEAAAMGARDRYEVMRGAAKLGLSDYISLRSNRDRNNAQARLEAVERELNDLKLSADQKLFEEGIDASERNIELKAAINELLQKRDLLSAKIGIIDRAGIARHDVDVRQIEALRRFFPTADIGMIEEIEAFHHKLTEILGDELAAQKEQYRSMMDSIDNQINRLRTELADMGQTGTLSTEEWDKAGELNGVIQLLQAQIGAWDKTEKLKTTMQEASEELRTRRPLLIKGMADTVNESLKQLNDSVDAGNNPPELRISETRGGKQSYTFGTERDTGAGTRAKDVILLDLTILEHTDLPVLIHDSTLLKNIGDEPIESIMELYAGTDATDKQVFIAFDKRGSYSGKTRRIVADHTVVSLNAGGRELYGRRWNRIEEREES